jgi:single-strand DNA-binding protein
MDLNKVTLIGNVTRDPESPTTPSGSNVTSFSLATKRRWQNDKKEQMESSEFHNLVAWGKLADIVKQYVVKGSKVYAEGRLQTRSWEGTDGVKKYRTEIVVENFILLGQHKSAETSATPELEPEDPNADKEINPAESPF